jgi:hypothetical protein
MRWLVLALMMRCIAGCSELSSLSTASLVGTDKTLVDHAVSLVTGKDCSLVRKEQGLTYCREDEVTPPDSILYCYHTLGEVTCYDRPNPYGGRQQRIGSEPPPPIAPPPPPLFAAPPQASR